MIDLARIAMSKAVNDIVSYISISMDNFRIYYISILVLMPLSLDFHGTSLSCFSSYLSCHYFLVGLVEFPLYIHLIP